MKKKRERIAARFGLRSASLPLLVGQSEISEGAGNNAICRDYINESSSAAGVTLPPTPLSLQNSFESPAACMGTEALQRRPPAGVKFLVSTRAITGARKFFSFDDPRDPYDSGFLDLPFLLPLSVFLAFGTADPLSMLALPVLPSAPLSCPVAALLATVTR